ncbi:TrkH family potassium uptake protein [Variovorax sp. MHTC-1]|uniref:TrkH family potassium uptake protein n=1 Tax=Variovorax sp. MHTC-1 TaxID=2495593 RepID=UPI000F869451|nr:potassium transporter TrkG [Variovorax sp. MHTC-1]RST50387.1 TrkH family potassium uptake protein [Variovorax sp. MHTC-1]
MTTRLSHPSSVLVLAFLTVICLGTVLLMLPASHAAGESAPWLTALFTATSAVCVTGLVVVDTGTYWSGFGQAVILGLFQLGGFGMMTSATLLGLLVNRQLRLRSRLLLQAETRSLGLGDVKSIAKLVLLVTVVVELVIALVLSARFAVGYGMGWSEALWHGMFHAVSAFNNAGFSTWSDSVVRFVQDVWVLGPLMFAIIVGGLGFPVLYETIVRRERRQAKSIHTILTIWGTVFLVVGGALLLLLAESGNKATLGSLDWPTRLLAATFTSVSARTAGFNALDIGSLSVESLNLHFLLMFIGGGSAGTAGGVKVTTFFVLLLVVWNEIRGHQDVEFQGRRISTTVQRQALTILVLSAGAIVLATLALVPMTSLPYEKVLFEVISAFATVGLSTGITAELPPAGQFILVVLMFTGRVGVVTLAAAMAVNYARRAYRYPEEKPIVG